MIQDTQGQDEVVEEKISRPYRKLLVAALVIGGSGWLTFPGISQLSSGIRSFQQEKITTSTVLRGELIRDVAISGKLVAANAPKVYSTEPGQISLLVKAGDTVEANDILARIKSPELDADIKQENSRLEKLKIEASRGELTDSESLLDLESTLDTARLKLNAEKRESKRTKTAYKKQVVSEYDFVKRKDALLEAELLYLHASKRVELAKKRLSFENKNRAFAVQRQQYIVQELERRLQNLNIKAPVDGIVGNLLVSQKELVADAKALLTVVDLSRYEAELNVPEFYADDLGIGLQVRLNLSGKHFEGTVSSISPEVNNSQIRIRVSIPTSGEINLRQNQRVNARIEFEKKTNVLMVKKGAFIKDTAGKNAFIIDGEYAELRPIRLGSTSVEFVELLSGIKEGDQLIISSYDDFNGENKIKLTN